ncbi:MAG TPA: hypothetical protein VMW67_05435 [Desulfobacteria bacterium]|nr:hypothetical protein [Desulfobacteria bacterium]
MEEDVDLVIVVDGEEIDANMFVQNIIGRAIASAVSALKGVKEDWDEIAVTVKRAK